MPRWGVLLGGLALCLLTGCISDTQGSASSWTETFRKFNTGKIGEMVQIDVALLERPVGDAFLNKEIWNPDFTDEQILDLDQQQGLAKNGFRIGQIVGPTPENLHDMLTSERCCVNPRRLVAENGKTTLIRLGPILPLCKYNVYQDGQSKEVTLAKAHPSLEVIPRITDEGETHLKFIPKMEYGESRSNFHAAKDRKGWVMEILRDNHSYPQLGWEITLAPGKYLIVGTWLDRLETLGSQSLIERDLNSPVQRVLVLRTTHSGTHGDDAQIAPPVNPNPSNPAKGLPLAMQAKMTTFRAYGK